MGAVTLYAPNGDVIDLDELKRDQAEASLASVRRVQPDHPSWGLSPEGLGMILQESETTDPSRLFALLDDVHEKEWHYRGVLGQRRLALAQLPQVVDPASDDAEHVKHADFIRLIMNQAEMTASKFDLSDALNKGISFGQIHWDTSGGQWMPTKIAYTDPRWFRFDRTDLTTPLLLDDFGQPQPLVPYKWAIHRPRLNSGLPIRDGLGRAAVWAWMFKNFDIKSWLIFLDKYGQPLRLGRFPQSASVAQRRSLLMALRNMGRDAAAIVPEGFTVEFPKTDASGSGDAFQSLATYFDEQLSKLVLGQTGTTDASKGGYAVGRVHEGVRDAICLYDGLMLATTLNRDLIKPAIDLNFGPQKAYPTLKIGLGDQKNLDAILQNIGDLVDRGLEVEQSQILPMLGLTEPATGPGVKLLVPAAKMPGGQPGPSSPPGSASRAAGQPGGGGGDVSTLSADPPPPSDSIDALAAEMGDDFSLLDDIRTQVSTAIDQSTSFDELKARLDGLAKGPASAKLIDKMALSMFNARLAGELGAPIGPRE